VTATDVPPRQDRRIPLRESLANTLADAMYSIEAANTYRDELYQADACDDADLSHGDSLDMGASFRKALRHLRDAQRILDLHKQAATR
jgi:hypothetical protein